MRRSEEKIYEKINEKTNKVNHHLVNEPEYMTLTEVASSYGFLKIMSILWTPAIIGIIIYIKYKKKQSKRR